MGRTSTDFNTRTNSVGLYDICAFGFQEVRATTYQRAATIDALPLLLFLVLGLLFGILAIVLHSST